MPITGFVGVVLKIHEIAALTDFGMCRSGVLDW
jgi:hypothetical protein